MTSSIIGIDTQTGQRIDIPQASRRQGTYIIGANGTGKTGLIENLVIQDIQQGLGVCLLDPHGDLTQAVLSRVPDTREKDVIYLDIADEDFPFGVNLFYCDNPKSIKAVQYVVDQVMHIFDKLFEVDRSTPLLSEYLRNCTHTLVVNPEYTMADIPLLLLNETCRKKLISGVTDPDVRLFWQVYEQMKPSEQREEAASTLRRVREFLQPLSRNIVGQANQRLICAM
jgi:Type IV secretion-system coupling protein DNA-binding domain